MSSADLVNNANGGGSPFACKLATCAVTRTNLFGKRKNETSLGGRVERAARSAWFDEPFAFKRRAKYADGRGEGGGREGGCKANFGKGGKCLGLGKGKAGGRGVGAEGKLEKREVGDGAGWA